jgi:nucleotide-binding universal stress UspA family protein
LAYGFTNAILGAVPRPIKKILVPVDGSEGSRLALWHALDLADTGGASVTALEVIEDFGPLPGKYDAAPDGIQRVPWLAEQRFEGIRAVLESGTVQWTRRVEEGYPAEVICQVATEEGTDLIIMGSRGLSPVARFLIGSVSDKVVRNAPCSVMVVR